MKLSKIERLSVYSILKNDLSDYSPTDIENGVMHYCLTDYGYNVSLYNDKTALNVSKKLEQSKLSTDLETITELFESLIDENNKDQN